ncbi:MAG: hypothetical protein L0Y66_19325 [Myxococcaceae bacterium]|nr:hypothetical protein [Myxococcaceae bacterium]MCI0671745.1 hypothetical protein [Myxococcaceae bacterium]
MRGWGALAALMAMGCAAGRVPVAERGEGGAGATGEPRAGPQTRVERPAQPFGLAEEELHQKRYVDRRLGFQVERPDEGWTLHLTNDAGEEGLVVPVVMRHASGATVVLQVAPAVATPFQYAESLTRGLREQMDLEPGDVEPLPLSESAVGFRFRMGAGMQGRVVVREGGQGRVFMVLATWPDDAPAGVPTDVDAIILSFQPVQAL